MRTTPRTSCEPDRDWSAIKAAYKANDVSIRALAGEHGLSDTAIRKRAKAEGWTRASRPDVLRTGNIAAHVSAGPEKPIDDTPGSLAEVATTDPKVLVSQGRDLVGRLLDELSASTTYLGEIEDIITEDTRDDKDGRRRYAMTKAVSLSTRAAVLKNLALAAKTLADSAVPVGGKKEERAAAAVEAGKVGRLATPAAPKLVVNNG